MKTKQEEECLFDKMMKECKCKHCKSNSGRKGSAKWWIIAILLLAIIGYASFTTAMYGGECEQVQLDFENLDNITYTSIGNQSDLEGLNISLNGSTVNICPVLNYKPDNFTIIFMENSIKEVEKEVIVYRGGGGSTKYVDRNVTEYVETLRYLDCIPEEKVETGECIQVEVPEEEQKTNIFKRIWNWIRGIFK